MQDNAGHWEEVIPLPSRTPLPRRTHLPKGMDDFPTS